MRDPQREAPGPQLPRWLGWPLLGLALASIAVLVTETAVFGAPHPWTVASTAILAGLAVSWPLVARAGAAPHPGWALCRDCGRASHESQQFGFCISCGSQRVLGGRMRLPA